MSDNTNQQRADEFDYPEPGTFVIVKNGVPKSQIAQDPNVPGLSEEQLKELPEALQAAVKTGKFADLDAVLTAMTREERSKFDDFIDAADCKINSGFSVHDLPPGVDAVTMQSLYELLDSQYEERSQNQVEYLRGLQKLEDRLAAEAKSLGDAWLDVTAKLNAFMAKDRGDLGKLLANLDMTDLRMEDLLRLRQDIIKGREGHDDLERLLLEMNLPGLQRQFEVLDKDVGNFEKQKEALINECTELDSEREYLGQLKEQVTKAFEHVKSKERRGSNSSSSSSDCKTM